MMYITHDGTGYTTELAKSDDLLHWEPQGTILGRQSEPVWDCNQVAGYIALQDTTWGGSYELERYDDKYWLSYIGGSKPGYETAPLSIGVASTPDPSLAVEWEHGAEAALTPSQSDVRWWENNSLYKSNIIHDKDETLGWPYIMYYNAVFDGGYEQIGMAVSRDMVHWTRYGKDPVVTHGGGISGDPQVVRIGTVWVMFYFGAGWCPGAVDRFACSYDLVHWTKWDGVDLVAPTEDWDAAYAHKPWVLKVDGVVYHFYCATGSQGRTIGLATSDPTLVKK
jgi:beta-xylosidase